MSTNKLTPYIIQGTRAEECIKNAITTEIVEGKRCTRFKRKMFESLIDIALDDAKSFNYSLYRGVCKYYKENTCCNYTPNEDEVLESFNNAYKIAYRALNTILPKSQYGKYVESIEKWVPDYEGYGQRRNIQEISLVFCMVYRILCQEPEMRPQIQDFLDYLADECEEELKAFGPVMQQSAPSTKPEEHDAGESASSATDENKLLNDNEDGAMSDEENREETIKRAISLLMEAKDENGTKIFKAKKHWFAVYCVLKEFDKKAYYLNTHEVFCQKITTWGFENCKRDNLARAISDHSNLCSQNPSKWPTCKYQASQADLKLIIIAEKFIELLNENFS